MTSLIGIAGGTGAGKTALVRGLTDRFGGCVIDLDSYYLDRSALPPHDRSRINYDEPAAIDATLLVEHLVLLARGEAVDKPLYSFKEHARVGVEVVSPARLVIVEGLFTLWWEPLRSLLEVKVFVDAPPDVRLIRRIRRDVAERGRVVEQVLQQYIDTVRPMHERYVEPTRAHADVVVANDGPIQGAVEWLVTAVRKMIVLEESDALEVPSILDDAASTP